MCRTKSILLVSVTLLLTASIALATPPTDVYYYTQLSWTVNGKMDVHVADFMEFHKDAPRYAIDAINNSPDILPNTTIHFVVEDHLNDPHYAVKLLDDFVSSAIYPIFMITIDAVHLPVVRHTAFRANSLGLLSGTIINAKNEFADTEVYPDFVRCVS